MAAEVLMVNFQIRQDGDIAEALNSRTGVRGARNWVVILDE